MAAERNSLISSYECRYCTSLSFKDIRALQYHLRAHHFVAEEVNVKGTLPRLDMLLCKVCNIYLDPGLKFMESSHQFTRYHQRNMGSSSTQTAAHPPVTLQETTGIQTDSDDDVDNCEQDISGSGSGDNGEEYRIPERDAMLLLGEDEALTEMHSQGRGKTTTDWMLDRDDQLDTTGYEDVVGWVWNCPFNNDLYPYSGTEGGMAEAALDPENYARYRAVHVLNERDSVADTETEVLTSLLVYFIQHQRLHHALIHSRYFLFPLLVRLSLCMTSICTNLQYIQREKIPEVKTFKGRRGNVPAMFPQ